MFLNRSRKRDRSFKHYFEIQGFVEVEAPISREEIRKLLGKKEMGG